MSPWEPGPRLLGNLYIIILGTLTTFTWKTWDPCREPWGNLLGTFWEPWGNLEEPWEPWEPWANLGNLGNLYLGTWEPLLGNLYLGTWEPLLGNLYLEPGNLGGMGFGAAPVCSETFTMAEDPKAFCCWGKITAWENPSRTHSPSLSALEMFTMWYGWAASSWCPYLLWLHNS